jgi:hypothetical protein
MAADRLPLLACMLVALCGCAPLHDSARHTAAPTAEPPVLPAPPAAAAEPAHQALPDTAEPPAASSAPAPARALDLLQYAEQYAGLSPEAQRQAMAAAETQYNTEQTSFALVRYALLLSLSEPDHQADAGTADKLRGLLAGPAVATDPDLVPFAQMLTHVLDERERLLAQNTELQRKLNQLKAIEQQLGDRTETLPATP